MSKKIYIPTINVNDEEVKLVEWLVDSGAKVEAGTEIATLETNKTALGLETDCSGYVYYQRERNSDCKVGDLLAVVSERILSVQEQNEVLRPDETEVQEQPALPPQPHSEAPVRVDGPRVLTTKARKLISAYGFSVADFAGTERITTSLVEARYQEKLAKTGREDAAPGPQQPSSVSSNVSQEASRPNAAAPPSHLTELSLSRAKKNEIKALTSTHAHVVQSEVASSVRWEKLRSKIATLSKQGSFTFSIGDVVTYCVSRLLPRYPELNGVYLSGKAYSHNSVNIGYAVNLGNGLLVPVLRETDQKGLHQLAKEMRTLFQRYARDEIESKDCLLGSFTITDLSSKRITGFRPVLNAGQSAILGISMQADLDAVQLILAFDHRLADGLVASNFLGELAAALEAFEEPVAGDGQAGTGGSAEHSPNKVVERERYPHGSAPSMPGRATKESPAAAGNIEAAVSRIWKEVLKLEALDNDVQFFEAGGNSVLAGALAQRISTEFGCDFPVLTIFKHPSVREMTEHLSMAATTFVSRSSNPSDPSAPTTGSRSKAAARRAIVDVVSEIWKEVLKRKSIALDDQFFEVGGDSALAGILAERIRATFSCAFSALTIFKYPTVNEMSRHIEASIGSDSVEAAVDVEDSGVSEPDSKAQAAGSLAHPQRLPGYFDDSFAIIGMSCTFPDARNHREFWSNLRDGRQSIRVLSEEELRERKIPEDLIRNPHFVPVHVDVPGTKTFDAEFFRISPSNASLMDPQFRQLLLHSWQAVEDAGYIAKEIPETCVFVSTSNGPSQGGAPVRVSRCSNIKNSDVLESSGDYVTYLLSQSGSIPTMISYQLGLKGPSLYVHSNCSSFLSSLFLACQSLGRRETKYALVGSAAISYAPRYGYIHQPGLNFSSDGRIKAFAAAADGMVEGEGVGAILVKRALDAVEDRDHIYGILRGIHINNDGSDKAGYYAPSVDGQSAVIDTVLEATSIHPETITYVEAHGTGTKLGDPIEISALSDAYSRHTDRKQYCGVGSLKPNIGHLDVAAGLAGCIKVLMSLYHKEIPPSINCSDVNPDINFPNSPFFVVNQLQAWNTDQLPRRAALTSLGIGGTNAHAIFEEFPGYEVLTPGQQSRSANARCVVPLSARSGDRVFAYVERLLSHLEASDLQAPSLRHLSYTLQVGRQAMESRVAFVCSDLKELVEQLRLFLARRVETGSTTPRGGKAPGPDPEPHNGPWYFGEVKDRGEGPAADDEIARDMVRAWIAEDRLDRLAKFWVTGGAVRWRDLYEDRDGHRTQEAHRMSLPTYPFNESIYGLDEHAGPASNVTALAEQAADGERTQGVETSALAALGSDPMCFEETWEGAALSTIPQNRGVAQHPRTVLCFLSGHEEQENVLDAYRSLSPDTELVFVQDESCSHKGTSSRRGLPGEVHPVRPDVPDGLEQVLRRIFETHKSIDEIIYLWGTESKRYVQDCSPIFHIIRTLLLLRRSIGEISLVGTYETLLERSYLESWIGFERSMRMVMPATRLNVIIDEATVGEAHGTWAKRLVQELVARDASPVSRHAAGSSSVLYENGKRHVCKVSTIALDEEASRALPHAAGRVSKEASSPFQSEGTYLITGGLGALGFHVAEHLLRRGAKKLILIGRSPLTEAKMGRKLALQKLGGNVLYLSADVCDPVAMQNAVASAKRTMGSIRGVIHAAGVEPHGFGFHSSMEEFERVLEPKVAGTLVLDRVLEDEPLDFVCYFSSISAVVGDYGSCDYSVANRFQMSYARYRNALQSQGRRSGKAVVINWPLWKDGGMGVGSADQTEFYLQSSGQRLLETGEALLLFERLLFLPKSQYLVVVGQRERAHRFLGITGTSSAAAASASTQQRSSPSPDKVPRSGPVPGVQEIEERVEWDLKSCMSEILKVPHERLTHHTNLANFGFDSISLTNLAQKLSLHYNIEITPALFFGHSTIEKLQKFFLSEHREHLETLYSADPRASESDPPDAQTPVVAAPSVDKGTGSRMPVARGDSLRFEPIAIIGRSGKFPGADSVSALWEVLRDGKSMVEEVPPDRFPWEEYYGNPAEDATKTNSKWGGFLSGAFEFDPLFFEISPKEAEEMDPRQRQLLQECWRALEDAGYGADQVRRHAVGVFVGAEEGDYDLDSTGRTTSNHDGILAARLSYFLDLHGPAMAINTSCSSGLVALHQAVNALRMGECDTALAAAVNTMFSPTAYVGMAQSGMLSPDGKCFTFDGRANGMVPGEAIAVVVLKRLADAERDRDPIHAVIRGSGINCDGRTNGITAPNGVAQKELLESVYRNFGIEPDRIEYVIAHGTGTKLGDPVEINALHDAFKPFTKRQGYCAITSTKTNFGHTLAASGLVSLISMVEALKHECIPASLHCEGLNSYIKWSDSPFYVNTTSRPWPKRAEDERWGAVSAFGMSGTNAHVVLQGYVPEGEPSRRQGRVASKAPSQLLVLSAKSQEALHQRVWDMLEFLRHGPVGDQDLLDVSYTLLGGRHHFAYRSAIVVKDVEDAMGKWEALLGGDQPADSYRGVVPRGFKGHGTIKQAMTELLENKISAKGDPKGYQESLGVLADLYCQGYEFDWEAVFRDGNARRISLPTYPFSREEFRMRTKGPETVRSEAQGSRRASIVQPLALANTSTLSDYRLSTAIAENAFFLEPLHPTQGKAVPGMVHVEMVLEGVRQAMAPPSGQPGCASGQKILLTDVKWAKPMMIEGDEGIHLGLLHRESEGIAFDVYTEGENGDGEAVVYCQGVATSCAADEPKHRDIQTLLDRNVHERVGPADFFRRFKAGADLFARAGMTLEEAFCGDHEVLAKISCRPSLSETKEPFRLPLGAVGVAVGAAIGAAVGGAGAGRHGFGATETVVPLAMERMEYFDRFADSTWAWIRVQPHHDVDLNGEGAVTHEVDMDLCDEGGRVLSRFEGLKVEAVYSQAVSGSSICPRESTYLKKSWEETPPSPDRSTTEARAPDRSKVAILCTRDTRRLADSVAGHFSSDSTVIDIEAAERRQGVVLDWKEYDGCVDLIGCGKASMVSLVWIPAVQELVEGRKRKGVNLLCVSRGLESFRNGSVNLAGADRVGLYRMLASEYAWVRSRHLDLANASTDVEMARHIVDEFFLSGDDVEVCYRGGRRYRARLVEVQQEANVVPKIEFPEDQVLWITGGTRGLGYLCAEHFVKNHGVKRVVLTGREDFPEWMLDPDNERIDTNVSPGMRKKMKAIRALRKLGAQVRVLSTSLDDEASVEKDVREVTKSFGRIGGVIHCAGIQDASNPAFIRKSTDEIQRVLGPKVSGLNFLVSHMSQEPLRFFLLYSSVSAIVPALATGQSDYAMANAYMDYVAEARPFDCPLISIQWPSWKETGMGEAVSEAYRQSGLLSITDEEGVGFLDEIVAMGRSGSVVFPCAVDRSRFKSDALLRP